MNQIRVEAGTTSDLARFYLWLSRHRGQVVSLDRARRLALGVPISGTRAVIVAVVLQHDEQPSPQLGGVLRALSNRSAAEPVTLVFEGRSPAQLSHEDASSTAAHLLRNVSALVAEDGPVAEVA